MSDNRRRQEARGVRAVSDDEISDWQGLSGGGLVNSDKKREQHAQARKRRQVRNQERFDETFGPYAAVLLIGTIVVMGIAAFVIELG